ncbi:hypothetical protein I9Y33_001438 [Clostridium perfringens]|nr:hypothetical protein [Clostridium perfringens]EGT0013575.1 hypothetical protein [Clostridium perfringens]
MKENERNFIKICSNKVIWSIVKDEKNEVEANVKNILYKIMQYPADREFILYNVIGEDVSNYCLSNKYDFNQKNELVEKIDNLVSKTLDKEYIKHLSMLNISERNVNYEVISTLKIISVIILVIISFSSTNKIIFFAIVGYLVGSIIFDFKKSTYYAIRLKIKNHRRKIKLYNTL